MSLYRHTATYLVGRGAPALVGLVAVGIYTRLVPPEEFGLFVLALSVVSFGNRTLFQWLRVAVVRFAPKHADPRSALVATAGVAFIALVVLGTAVGAGVWTVLAGHPVGSLVPVGVAGLCALGWFELCLEFLRARGQAVSYAAASVLRAVLTLGLSWFLAVRGHGSQGLLLGVAAGWVVAPLPFIRRIRPRGRTAPPDPRLLRGLFRYGAPLTLAFLLDGVVIASDRLLVGWLRGVDAAGLYGVAADLTMNALLMLMQPVHLAAMPLIVHALEARGERAARDELLDNLRVLLALGLPAAVGLAMLAGNVAHVVLGAEYRVAAVALLPLVAAATLLSGLRAYYVDLSFQLGQRTEMLIRVAAAAATIMVAANLILIPRLGAVGAAWSAVGTHGVALALSWRLSRRVFPLPLPGFDVLRIGGPTLVMTVPLWGLAAGRGAGALAMQVSARGRGVSGRPVDGRRGRRARRAAPLDA